MTADPMLLVPVYQFRGLKTRSIDVFLTLIAFDPDTSIGTLRDAQVQRFV